jgi:hypothetical protein
MKPIFISYRRSDLSLEAEWIYNLICTFFGENMVFFDKKEIESGKRWDDTLRKNVSEANIVLILIGPKWLKEQLESGMRRLDDPEDWVRQEIFTALDSFKIQPHNRWIFPVLLNEAILPRKEWLPKELEELTSFQIEKELEFNIKNFKEAASNLYSFIKQKLEKLDLLNESETRIFQPDVVPNPYEIKGYQLPEKLRSSRPKMPFKGLEFFKRDDARIFFGRRKEIGEIIDYFKKSQLILRIYGQSGVGKSSLLFAGLFPRMEANGWIIRYFRRDKHISLEQSLLIVVNELNQSDNTDSLIILDQVEEIITNPNIENPKNELEELVKVISNLKDINSRRKKNIRLILCYRKEYDVNIKSALQENEVYSNEYWLKDLSETGMRDAITGIIKDQDINDAYHLQIEKGLDDLIISELLNNGKGEDTTPLMQILLRKMWYKVSQLDISKRILNRELYEECKSNDLVDFLKECFTTLSAKEKDQEIKNAVESGLSLDVLKCFTTEQDTASSLSEEIILKRYHINAPIKNILQALVDVYILIRIENSSYRIPHDSLAKAVRIQYNNSQLPGQRAAILLNSKKYEIEKDDDVEFSNTDLAIIDSGKHGMRKWSTKEETAIKNSYNKNIAKEKTILEQKEQIQSRLEESLKANSYSIVNFLRLTEQQEDFRKAFRFSELAYEISENVVSISSLIKSFSKLTGNYNITIPEFSQYSGLRSMNITKDGLIILGTVGGILIKVDFEERKIVELYPCSKRKINSIKFSSNNNFAITASDDRLVIWEKEFNEVRSANRDIFKLGDINSAEFSFDLSKIVIAFDAGRVLITDVLFNIIKEIPVGNHLVNSVALSPNGHFIICTTNDAKMYLFNYSGEKLSEYESEERPIKKCSFSPDGKKIVTASEDGTARFFNFSNDKLIENAIVFDGQIGHVTTAEFSPDSTMIVTCSSVIKVWDCITGECIVSIDNNEGATVARFSNDSTGIYVIGSGMSFYFVRAVKIMENVQSMDVPQLSSADLFDIGIDNIDNSRPGFNRLKYLMESNNAELIKSFADYYKGLGEREFTIDKPTFRRHCG